MATRDERAWTTVADVVEVLQRRWRGGRYLRQYAAGEPWEPLSLPVRGPKAAELLDRLAEVRGWLTRFERAAGARVRIEHRTVRGRRTGANEIPARIWVDGYPQLFALLGVEDDVRTLELIIEQTRIRQPELVPWVVAHPQVAIDHDDVWGDLLSTVGWIAAHEPSNLYLRHIDVEGVDTKFVESYRQILADLLAEVLPADRIDDRFGRYDFAGRFRFRRKPDYTRLRLLSSPTVLPTGLSELTLRTEELARLDPGVSRVFIVENEISYLAFPDVPDAIVVFGSGFALSTLKALTWLDDKELLYWGDIDTYGFAILDRLRGRFSNVRSILMDHETLMAHPRQWVIEPVPTAVALPHLDAVESELYADLVEDRFGHHVRLEQERVRFSRVRAALAAYVS